MATKRAVLELFSAWVVGFYLGEPTATVSRLAQNSNCQRKGCSMHLELHLDGDKSPMMSVIKVILSVEKFWFGSL